MTKDIPVSFFCASTSLALSYFLKRTSPISLNCGSVFQHVFIWQLPDIPWHWQSFFSNLRTICWEIVSVPPSSFNSWKFKAINSWRNSLIETSRWAPTAQFHHPLRHFVNYNHNRIVWISKAFVECQKVEAIGIKKWAADTRKGGATRNHHSFGLRFRSNEYW